MRLQRDWQGATVRLPAELHTVLKKKLIDSNISNADFFTTVAIAYITGDLQIPVVEGRPFLNKANRFVVSVDQLCKVPMYDRDGKLINPSECGMEV